MFTLIDVLVFPAFLQPRNFKNSSKIASPCNLSLPNATVSVQDVSPSREIPEGGRALGYCPAMASVKLERSKEKKDRKEKQKEEDEADEADARTAASACALFLS